MPGNRPFTLLRVISTTHRSSGANTPEKLVTSDTETLHSYKELGNLGAVRHSKIVQLSERFIRDLVH